MCGASTGKAAIQRVDSYCNKVIKRRPRPKKAAAATTLRYRAFALALSLALEIACIEVQKNGAFLLNF